MSSINSFRNYCRSNLYGAITGVLVFLILVHFFVPENVHLVQIHESQSIQKPSSEWCSLNLEEIEEEFLNLDQKDAHLIKYVRARYISPPSKLPYNLNKNEVSRDTFSGWVADFFGNKRNGIFIEAGANEGEKSSHTLYLEKELGWTGLLIECNPTVTPMLRTHHRKAWVASACLAPTSTPGILNFSNPTNWTYSGTFKQPWNLPVPTKWTFFDVETIPLYTILAAVDMYEIDYFSFDIEGMELSVLEKFPFDLVIFKLLIIEIYFYKEDELKKLNALLARNGYHLVKKIEIDNVYVHESAMHLVKNGTSKS